MANWVINVVGEEVNARHVSVGEIGITPGRLVDLVKAIEGGKVSKQKAKDVFKAMLGNERGVVDVIQALGLGQISDDSFLREAVKEVLEAHPEAAEDVRNGKKNSFNFLMGQVMKRTKGKANPGMVNKMLEEVLGRGTTG